MSDDQNTQHEPPKQHEVIMEIDMRKHANIREQVRSGLIALKVQGRQIWGEDKLGVAGVVLRLMVGVGDLARLTRDGFPGGPNLNLEEQKALLDYRRQIKKELGNVIFSTVRWIDDLGYDAIECLDLAIEAQEKFAKSGRAR